MATTEPTTTTKTDGITTGTTALLFGNNNQKHLLCSEHLIWLFVVCYHSNIYVNKTTMQNVSCLCFRVTYNTYND